MQEVRSGADLYGLCRKQTVDLVILEETLDNVSARSVCRTLKSLDHAPMVIIVVESTNPDLIDDAKDAHGCRMCMAIGIAARRFVIDRCHDAECPLAVGRMELPCP